MVDYDDGQFRLYYTHKKINFCIAIQEKFFFWNPNSVHGSNGALYIEYIQPSSMEGGHLASSFFIQVHTSGTRTCIRMVSTKMSATYIPLNSGKCNEPYAIRERVKLSGALGTEIRPTFFGGTACVTVVLLLLGAWTFLGEEAGGGTFVPCFGWVSCCSWGGDASLFFPRRRPRACAGMGALSKSRPRTRAR